MLLPVLSLLTFQFPIGIGGWMEGSLSRCSIQDVNFLQEFRPVYMVNFLHQSLQEIHLACFGYLRDNTYYPTIAVIIVFKKHHVIYFVSLFYCLTFPNFQFHIKMQNWTNSYYKYLNLFISS